jgi:hypothetical protein
MLRSFGGSIRPADQYGTRPAQEPHLTSEEVHHLSAGADTPEGQETRTRPRARSYFYDTTTGIKKKEHRSTH